MKQKLDIENWVRKEHFNFFKAFDEPFYGVCVNVDCTAAYKAAKEMGVSFYLYTLYKALAAAQVVEPFRLRIEGDEVFVYDKINAASTIGRSNGTFGFGYIDYYPSFEEYIVLANQEVERVQNSILLDKATGYDLIRFSSLPWIDFTSISHARMFSGKDSCPSISFGKMTECNGKRSMPVSVHVHHALVDGLHIGQYIDCLQELMNKNV
jgi:chloramphenicol O-acetyltransferase type A